MAAYRPVNPQVDLPKLEHQILKFWQQNDIFTKSLEQTQSGTPWTFYEGPPTANGQPGTHHVEARVFKDVFPRYQTMRGRFVERKGGWDCHGLPVELAVEKELGFSGKAEIENYGIAEFNAKCRESVQRHVGEFEAMTARMGYWVDTKNPYRTMDSSYVESVWWALTEIHKKGLLVEDYRVSPYCPRCGTGLSDHELAQGYEDVIDPSVYVRMPLTSGPLAGIASLLIWTTTPWTLVSNALVAANAGLEYVAVQSATETLILAKSLLAKTLGEDWESNWKITDSFTGTELVGWTYQRPFELLDWPGEAHFVVTEAYVTAEDGTGLVHQAPAFGEDDFASCRRNNVDLINPINEQGEFFAELELVGGVFFRDANPVLIADLSSRNLLFKSTEYEHSYPHCWRCHTALIYYAQPSWYIRTTAIKAELIAENEKTNWFPSTIKHGRFGDWLENNIDWALSRKRYWGTPLPIWRCAAQHQTCVASLAQLSELTGTDQSQLDPHRPFVDEVTFSCPDCGELATRVPEVIDAWFDSGAMPFAQWGYPHQPGSVEKFAQTYPADFICEAIDQTRGWFYTLMAVGTLVFTESSYRNVLCLGHILAEDGRKMSKHLGNILLPMPLMDEHGADAIRWFMAASGSPWSARRVGHAAIGEAVRKVLLTYWNTVSFQSLYARSSAWVPDVTALPSEHVLDRWLISETDQLVNQITSAYDNFDTMRVGALLADFVDKLSNWYVRRSRRRFWDGDPAALQTLHNVLVTVTKLLAPLTPFITEQVWQDLVCSTDKKAPESVHLASWPDSGTPDLALSIQMQQARRIVELGRAARANAGVKTRQPLQRALIATTSFQNLTAELKTEITDELNILALEPFGSGELSLVTHSAKGNFRELGKRFAADTPKVAAAIAAADASELLRQLTETGAAQLIFNDETIQLSATDLVITEQPLEGWAVANEHGDTVALDLTLTPELARAGIAREVVRLVQDARKTSGFEVTDRISWTWQATEETSKAILEHQENIANEVLATKVASAEISAPNLFEYPEIGLKFKVAKQ